MSTPLAERRHTLDLWGTRATDWGEIIEGACAGRKDRQIFVVSIFIDRRLLLPR